MPSVWVVSWIVGQALSIPNHKYIFDENIEWAYLFTIKEHRGKVCLISTYDRYFLIQSILMKCFSY